MRSASAILMSHIEDITCLLQIVTLRGLRGCEEKNGGTKGYRGSNIIQAL